jgi:hypothetical protein
MKKPAGYDETQVSREFTPVTLGGHHLIIKKVEESQSKQGKPMIIVYFDMAKNDSQADYMANEFRNDIRPDKKWPRTGTQYIVSEDDQGKCSRSFKSFITCFEHSNDCEADWGAKFCSQFKDKKIGGVFGEVENEYNGKVTMRHELRWFCSDDRVEDAAIPAPKYLNGSSASAPAPTSDTDPTGFIAVPEGAENDLPF